MHFTTNTDLAISGHFERILESQISSVALPKFETITLNFRDPAYSAQNGGFCPVEIMVGCNRLIWYITEFIYVDSGDFSELAISTDFDFKFRTYRDQFRGYPIESCKEYFELWQSNFCAYYDMDVYEVTMTEMEANK